MTALELVNDDGERIGFWTSSGVELERPSAEIRLAVPGHLGESACLLGVPTDGIRTAPALISDFVILVEVSAPDAPVGTIDLVIELGGSGLIRSRTHRPGETTDLTIGAPYGLLVGWMAGSVTAGNLLWAGASLSGDVLLLSPAQGIVGAERPQQAAVTLPLLDICARSGIETGRGWNDLTGST